MLRMCPLEEMHWKLGPRYSSIFLHFEGDSTMSRENSGDRRGAALGAAFGAVLDAGSDLAFVVAFLGGIGRERDTQAERGLRI